MTRVIDRIVRLRSDGTNWLWRQTSKRVGVPAGSMRLRLARGTLWALVGTAGSQSLGLVLAVLLARVLGQGGFGEYGVIVSTVGTLGVFSGMGLGVTATRHVAELRGRDSARAGRILTLCRWTAVVSGAAMAIGIAVAAPYVATRVLNAPGLTVDLRIACGLLFFNTLSGIPNGGLAGFEAFDTLAGIAALRGGAALAMAAAGVYAYGLRGALVALVAAAAVGVVLSERALRARCKRAGMTCGPHLALREWPVLWSFSLPAFLSSAMITPVTWFGSVLVVNRPGGYPEIGVFNAAGQWRQLLLFVPAVIAQAFVPILSNEFGEGHRKSFRKLLLVNLLVVVASLCVLGVPIVVFSRQVMSVFGPGFADGVTVLRYLCAATGLAAVAGVAANGITSLGKMWHGFWLNVIWAAAFVGCAVWFAKGLALGLARAYLVSYCLHATLAGLYVLFIMERLQGEGDRAIPRADEAGSR